MVKRIFLPVFFGAFTVLGVLQIQSRSDLALAKTSAFGKKILVIGHRGASGHRPEHTLESYTLAIEQGADFIEPDVVSTKDGILVARHENEISETTDVAAKFPQRKTEKTIDGRKISGWFTEDFTLAEIKQLRAKERLAKRSHDHDGKFAIPTLDEVIELAKKEGVKRGRTIGVYIETKHPTYFRAIGLPLEPTLLKTLNTQGWKDFSAPVIIQSFELSNLREMSQVTDVRLVLLFDEGDKRPFDFTSKRDQRTYQDLLKPEELKRLAGFLYGIGPSKRLIVPADKTGRLLKPTALVANAHQAGLRVHAYTFRSDPDYLAEDYKGDPEKEYRQFAELGVDGVFTDFPDHAVKVLK